MSVLTQNEAGNELAPLPTGSELAPGYRVINHLRRGSDFDVYDVWSDERYCQCFAKALRPDRLHKMRARHRLEVEGQLLLGSTHPHLVRAYELIESGPSAAAVLILETISGATLSVILDEARRRLPATEVAYLGQHLCSAIRYLHDRGYLHLDLKPDNIISEAGRAKVIDLSIAARPGNHHGGIGTRPYMAPEQAKGGYLGPPADVWGIGLVLYEAASGIQPFDPPDDESLSSESETNDEETYRQLSAPAPPIRTLRRLPRALSSIIDGCLRVNPAERPSVTEVSAALATITGDELPVAETGLHSATS
jgi:serine/threonine protein kinase